MSDPVVVPRVDAEFMALIPPLTADEKALLEESLVREGCRDALVVWKAKNILLDGHTRLDICQRRGSSTERWRSNCPTARRRLTGSTATS